MSELGEFLQFDDPVVCTITRNSGGSFNEAGQWVNGASATVTFTAEIQPKSGARRAQEAGTKYASSHWLICAPGTDIHPGDTVSAGGVNYTVGHVADWVTQLEADVERIQ